MKKQNRDINTIDMFDELPPSPASGDGSLACRVEIAHIMSNAMKGQDRYEIACKMSKLIGRNVSKARLDNMSAESAEAHCPPYDWAIAFDAATGSIALTEFAARKLGARLVVGREVLDAKLGRLERMRDEATKEIKRLKKAMGERDD